MSKLILVLSLLSLISACVGQAQVVLQAGQCESNINVVTDFIASQYTGVWYDIESLPTNFQSGTCNTARYTLADSGAINIQNTQVLSSLLQFQTGTATQTAGIPATTARFNALIGSNTVPYWVLDTDYTSFALVYSCVNVGNQRQINLWKLGRQTGPLSAAITQRINNVIAGIPTLNVIPSTSYVTRSHSAASCTYFVDLDGQCPTTITGDANFDATRFLGTWFEVARYPQIGQTGQCNRATYTAGTAANTISVENSQVFNEALGTISGQATTTAQPGVLEVTLNVGGVPSVQTLYVLTTDHDNYALLYSCTPLSDTRRRVGSWQLRKNLNPLTQEATNAINAAIAANVDLLEVYYQPTSQTDDACFYYPVYDPLPPAIELPGLCDTTITGVANFDVPRFLGTWLEVARYPQPTQTGQCNRAVYSAGAAANTVSIVNSQVVGEAFASITGQATTTAQSGVLAVTLNTGSGPLVRNLHVLATDYDNYALLYSCTDIVPNRRQVSSWQLRKNLTPLTQEALNNINTVIAATEGLREEYYQPTSQSDEACWFYPELGPNPPTIELPGLCDTTVTGVANFDAARYLGTWLEVARYPQPTQTGQCNRAVYSAGAAANTVNIVNSQVVDEELLSITGQATTTAQSGVLAVTLNTGSGPLEQSLYVLATDYDNYALLYSCTNILPNRRRVGSWQLRKTLTPLTAEATNDINAAIAAVQGLNQDYYQPTSQTDVACFYYPVYDPLPPAIELPGLCDTTITGVANFDVPRFLGTWLEVARYPQPTQTGQCNRAVYSAGAAANTVSIVNSQVVGEAFASITGQATTTAQSGVLAVTLNTGSGPLVRNLHVLTTDYDNYALLYSCTDIAPNRRQVSSWQLRKNLTPLTQEALNNINTVIAATEGLREEYYQPTSQSDEACWFYPDLGPNPPTIELPGLCDTTVTGVANFDAARYVGTWLEVARYPQSTQTGQCNRAVYSAGDAANTVNIVNSQVVDEELLSITGQATTTAQSGVLAVTLNTGSGPLEQSLYVLATDYDNYALLYSCTNILPNRRRVGSWQLRKTLTPLTAEATNDINAAIAAVQGLNQDYYQPTSQTDVACFYYPVYDPLPPFIELPGLCDTRITGVANFDVTRFLGTWLEAARYPEPTQTGQCNRAVYTAGAAGAVSIVNSQVVDEELLSITGQATTTAQSGVLSVTLNTGSGPVVRNLHVLATDYENYALLYSCTEDTETNRRRVRSWQMRRNTNPPTQAATDAINAAIAETQGLSQSYYQPTSQTTDACWYFPPQTGENVILPGVCNTTISGMANINLASFAEDTIWYQVSRYDAVGDRSCIGTRLRLNGENINVNSIEVVGEEASKSAGVARLTLAANGQFTFSSEGSEDERQIYVMATDYEGFAIAYSCQNIGTNRQVGAWLLSRDKLSFPAAGNTSLNTLIDQQRDFTNADGYFKSVQQSADCPDPSSAFLFKSSIIMIFVCTVLHFAW